MISKKAQIYGQALFECEASQKMLEQLKALSLLWLEFEIQNFFLCVTVSKKDKKALLNQALKTCPPRLKNFFYVLLDNKNLSLLPQIAEFYQDLLDKKDNKLRGTVYSPSPLTLEQKKELENILSLFFNKKLELCHKEDKKLMAGGLVYAGDFIFNGSVKYQLERFKSSGGL